MDTWIHCFHLSYFRKEHLIIKHAFSAESLVSENIEACRFDIHSNFFDMLARSLYYNVKISPTNKWAPCDFYGQEMP